MLLTAGIISLIAVSSGYWYYSQSNTTTQIPPRLKSLTRDRPHPPNRRPPTLKNAK